MKEKKIIPFKRALTYIGISCVATIILFFSLLKIWTNHKIERWQNPHYIVDRLIQTGPDKGALPTAYLCEMMGLSKDKPLHLDLIDLKSLEAKLYASPVIERVEMKKIYPSSLYLDYTVRRPIAMVIDFENTATDDSGHLFPLFPYFTPKRLTQIYFGDLSPSSYSVENHPKFSLVKSLFHLIQYAKAFQHSFIERIDVSLAYHPSLGRREIVIILRNNHQRHLLRLPSKGYSKQLGNYINLSHKLNSSLHTDWVIDLRLPSLAYLEPIS